MYELLATGFQAGLGAAVIRNAMGYLKKAMADGKLDKYEVKMLGATVVSNVLYASIYILLGLETEAAVGLSVLTDIFVDSRKTPVVVKK